MFKEPNLLEVITLKMAASYFINIFVIWNDIQIEYL